MDLVNDKLTREYNSLDNILLYMINHGLLSEIERRIIVSQVTLDGRHSAIYKIMREKSKKKASDILKILAHFHATDYSMSDLSCFENLESSNEVNYDSNSVDHKQKATNAMLNATVVKHVFQYLQLDEILECRLVCEMWSTVADPIVRKKAKIVFVNLEPDQFVRIFQNHLPSQPFTSFEFKKTDCQHNTAIKIQSMNYFFEKWGSKIKDLIWYRATIRNEKRKYMKKLNVDSWLRAAENLVSLNIDCGDTRFEISLSSLLGVSILNLSTCTVVLDVDRKISPSKIVLEYITFRRDKLEVESIYLNTIINFKDTSDLIIGEDDEEDTYLDLDFGTESVELDKLVVAHPDLEWENGHNWQVNCLVLQSMNVNRKINMIINELYIFEFENCERTIDLSALPETIQKLNIICCNTLKFICTQQVNLPNLKQLCVDFFGSIPTVFTDFLVCLSLESITFEKYYCRYDEEDNTDDAAINLNLDLAFIPDSVKAIKVHNNVNFIGDKVLNLDKLVLNEYSLSKMDELMQKPFKLKVLVLDWKQENYETNDSLVLFMCRNKVQTLMVGGFKWTFWRFQETRLSKLVDKQSTHYEFKQGLGVAITSEQFDEEIKLFTGSFDKSDFPLD